MEKKVFTNTVFIGIFLFVFFLFSGKVYAETELKVNENGDIIWTAKSRKATSGIRWQTQGYYIFTEPSGKFFGRPLETGNPYATIYVDDRYVSVISEKTVDGIYETEVKLKGEYIKEKIIENRKLYSKFIENAVNGKKKIYLNSFFETYSVVTDSQIKNKIKYLYEQRTPEERLKGDKYVYIDGVKYDYDKKHDVAKRIRKNRISTLSGIENAEAWSNIYGQWSNNEYYDHEVEYNIRANAVIRYVDKRDEVIGRKTDKKWDKRSKIKEVLNDGEKVLNPHFEYQNYKDKRPFINNEKKYVGDTAKISLPKILTIEKGGKEVKYKLVRSYIKDKEKGNKKNIKKGKKADTRKFTLGLKDLLVYGEYEPDEPLPEDKNSLIRGSFNEPEAVARIRSGTLQGSEFDIEKGIPVTESYFKQVKTDSYLLNYIFKKIEGTKKYRIQSRITWNLSWTVIVGTGKDAKPVQMTAKRSVIYKNTVKRKFSYWIVELFEVYNLDGAVLNNEAIPDTGVKMLPRGYLPPVVNADVNKSESFHLRAPEESLRVIDLGQRSASGMTPPDYDPVYEVEAIVGEPFVKNDSLIFNGKVIMDGTEMRGSTKEPARPETNGSTIGDDVLYEFGKRIESFIRNGDYESTGSVFYVLNRRIGEKGEDNLEFYIENINPVKVHTPIICDYRIDDAREWCQLIKPDLSRYQLVLTKSFMIDVITAGSHLNIPGYGHRDYVKYVKKKEIVFPFDVVCNGRIYRAETAVPVFNNTEFSLPAYVKEGKYDIKLKSYALNSHGEEDGEENYANLYEGNYIAVNTIFVEISGRLIDLTLAKIKNTSVWEKEFDKGEFKNGVRLDTLPLIEGDHPKYLNEGGFKKGYAVKIEITTIGEYYKEPYGVGFDFEFYIYDESFKNRKAVDVYYEAYSERTGEYLGLVKVGSGKDRKNIHYYEEKIPLFTYDRLLLPNTMLAVGSKENIQRWRGEYTLPEKIYVCEKGFPLEKFMKSNMALYFNEAFWIKKGNLAVSADIYTMKGGERILSYINSENSLKGFLNNWAYETRNRRKYTRTGEKAEFKDGEFLVYNLKKSIWQERRAEVKLLN